MRKYKTLIAGSALALSAPALANDAPTPARPDLDPAVWVVKDADTTIYLFGTVHMLDGKADWFNDEVKASFDASKELVIEMIQPEDPMSVLPLIQKYGLDMSGAKLRDKLPEGYRAKLVEKAAAIGFPEALVDNLKPGFAALMISAASFKDAGYLPELGAEQVLTKAAKDGGKTIGEVESLEYQLKLFDGLSEKDQVDWLKAVLDKGSKPEDMAKLMEAWGRGDPDALAKEMASDKEDTDVMRELLLTGRNRNWADWIQKRLDTPGTVFMAVGAGHLAGKESVQHFLSLKGIASARVVPATHAH